MDDLSFLELFMLRSLVVARIQELTILLKKRETNLQANEMLDIYQPMFDKLDAEIIKRSTK